MWAYCSCNISLRYVLFNKVFSTLVPCHTTEMYYVMTDISATGWLTIHTNVWAMSLYCYNLRVNCFDNKLCTWTMHHLGRGPCIGLHNTEKDAYQQFIQITLWHEEYALHHVLDYWVTNACDLLWQPGRSMANWSPLVHVCTCVSQVGRSLSILGEFI